MSSDLSHLLHGAEIREGFLVSGDATVMAFTRHENNAARNNFVLVDLEDKKLFCDPSVSKWLPGAISSHLNKLSKTIAEKPTTVSTATVVESSPVSSSKKSKTTSVGGRGKNIRR